MDALTAATTPLKTVSVAFQKIPSSIAAVSSKLKASAPSSMPMVSSLKTAGASVKAMGPIIQKSSGSFKTVVVKIKNAAVAQTAHVRSIHRRTWLIIGGALSGAGIFLLAGFGFYHLFIFENKPPIVADIPVLLEQKTPVVPAMSVEKKPCRLHPINGQKASLQRNPRLFPASRPTKSNRLR
jgi:hypothetical protein